MLPQNKKRIGLYREWRQVVAKSVNVQWFYRVFAGKNFFEKIKEFF